MLHPGQVTFEMVKSASPAETRINEHIGLRFTNLLDWSRVNEFYSVTPLLSCTNRRVRKAVRCSINSSEHQCHHASWSSPPTSTVTKWFPALVWFNNKADGESRCVTTKSCRPFPSKPRAGDRAVCETKVVHDVKPALNPLISSTINWMMAVVSRAAKVLASCH